MILKEYLKLIDKKLDSLDLNDLFNDIRKLRIKEVIVNQDEMFVIVVFVLYYTKYSPENLHIIKEGKIDKFMGVKLKETKQ